MDVRDNSVQMAPQDCLLLDCVGSWHQAIFISSMLKRNILVVTDDVPREVPGVFSRWCCLQSTEFFAEGIHSLITRCDDILIRSNEMQQYAGVCLLQNYSTCLGCLSHSSSGVHQTVTATCGTGHITCPSNNLPPAWPLSILESCRYKRQAENARTFE